MRQPYYPNEKTQANPLCYETMTGENLMTIDSACEAGQIRLSATLLLGSEDAARELQGDLAPLLKLTGISRRQIQTGTGYLSLESVVRFLNEGAKYFGCEDFGFLIGRHQPPVRFAMIGKLLRFAPTLEDSINDGIRYSILNSGYSSWTLEQESGVALLTRRTRAAYDAPLAQLQTLALVIVYKAVNTVCGHSVPLSQVMFSHKRIGSTQQLEKFFGAPVSFDQQFNAIVLPQKSLATPLTTRDDRLHETISHQLRDLASKETFDDAAYSLRLFVLRTLGTPNCTLRGFCEEMHAHPRALQRELASRGINFKAFLAQVRHELARNYLRNSELSMLELSDLLGYSNPSAFSRAFKSIAGSSPAAWKQRLATQD